MIFVSKNLDHVNYTEIVTISEGSQVNEKIASKVYFDKHIHFYYKNNVKYYIIAL